MRAALHLRDCTVRTLIPFCFMGARTVSMHWLNVRGASDMPKGRTRNSNILPSKLNLRKRQCPCQMGIWKYASLRSMVINQSPAVMACLTLGTVNILHLMGGGTSSYSGPQGAQQISPPESLPFGDHKVAGKELGLAIPLWPALSSLMAALSKRVEHLRMLGVVHSGERG